VRRDASSTILDKAQVAPAHYWMRLLCAWAPDSVEPGQFLHLQLPDDTDPLLRRPYTVFRVDETSVDILFQVVGKGSGLLADLQVGDPVRVLGPLGRGFTSPSEDATALIVAGGVGMASLLLLVERLASEGVSTRVFLGSRSRQYFLCREDLAALDVPLDVATDDGTEGHHGFVTDLAAEVLDREAPANPHVYACGPTPMMKALAKITGDRGIPTQVALENRMGCALGVCLGCVVPVESANGLTYERVCTEGPVFDARRVVWEYRL